MPGPECLLRHYQVVFVQQALQSIANHRACLDQPVPIGNETAQFTHVHGRHPHFRHDPTDQRPQHTFDIFLVRFDPRSHDLSHSGCIGHQHTADQRRHNVIGLPHVRGRFQHHNISFAKILLRPFRKFCDADPSWRQHPLLVLVLPTHQKVFPVDVQARYLS